MPVLESITEEFAPPVIYTQNTQSPNYWFSGSAELFIGAASNLSIQTEIILREVRVFGAVFRLNEPIQIAVFYEDGIWSCESRALSILAFGSSQQEALDSFREDFSAMWDIIGQSPDDSLTPGALEVKRTIHRIVRAVDVEPVECR